MAEKTNLYLDYISKLKKGYQISSFDDLKVHLSNELLIYHQFDLPREFDLIDISKLPYNFRFMKNFSRTHSFVKSIDFVKQELLDYFKYAEPEKKTEDISTSAKKDVVTNFRQVFFDIHTEEGKKVVSEDITDYSLEAASLDSLKSVIHNFSYDIQNIPKQDNIIPSNELTISSKMKGLDGDSLKQQSSKSQQSFTEIESLMKNFSIENFEKKITEESLKNEPSDEDLVNETFKMLGLGSIRKNLGKTIITKKRSEGLFFDEWVQEHLDWVQFLIKSIIHEDYLSLKEESHYLNVVRRYDFSDSFEKELIALYKKLNLDQ